MKRRARTSSPDELPAELRRLGVFVILGIVVWSVSLWTLHAAMEGARQHATTADRCR